MESKIVEAKLDENFIATLPELDAETMQEFDIYLDGNIYKPTVTETERRTKDEFKPNIPDNLVGSKTLDVISQKITLSKVINLAVGIVHDMNPDENMDPALYELRLAIISVILLSGCFKYERNNNCKMVKKDDYDQYYKTIISNKSNKKIVKSVVEHMNIAFNFVAFSVLNFIRFNHHFPSDKRHIIRKALTGMGEDIVKKYSSDTYIDAFYNNLVTAAKIVDDDLFFRTYIKPNTRERDQYYKLKKLGLIHLQVNDEVIKLRVSPTPNTFLICDIIHKIVQDMVSKKLVSLLPNYSLFKRILEIRNTIKLNPFAFHPSRLFFKYTDFSEEYEKIRQEFLGIMDIIGSFVFVYSEQMYSSVSNAKCRNKYEDKIQKEDEELVKVINTIYSAQYKVPEEKIAEIREKIKVIDISKFNIGEYDTIENEREDELKKLFS